MPTLGHILYIPGVLILGLAIGFKLGASAVRKELERQAEKRRR